MTPQELKASILQLAIQGKLVPQIPEEGTGEELYKQIQAEKQRLIKEGKIKKEKTLPEIADDEIPFDVPETWRWIRLGELIGIIGGVSYKKEDAGKHGIRILRGGNIQSMKVLLDEDDVFLPHEYMDKEKQVRVGDILIVASTGSKTVIGKAGYVDREMPETMIGAFLRICRPFYLETAEYLRCLFDSEFYRKHIRDLSQGTNINNVKESHITEFVVPIPPLAEQKRIVAKIEELLPLIDRYEKAWSELEEFNKRFPVDMQKSILQTAIQGKLVPQLPEEEGTGEELFQQIQKEKQRLIKEGKIKKEKPLPEIAEDEIPFDIPDTWRWIRLGDCSTYTQRKEKVRPVDITNDMWSLDLEDIEKGTGRIIQYCKASERKIAGDKVKFYTGQVLYSKLRPYLKKVLVAPAEGICTGEIVPFSIYANIEPQYIVYVLTCPHVDYVINSVTYGVKMPRVGTDTMVNLLIPLPPIAEQKRIVAKLEEILPLCEKLK